MGNRKAVIEQAVIELIDCLLPNYLEIGSLEEAVNTSTLHETNPWGFESQDKFLNQAFCCVTELEPQQVLSECLRIETELGRVRVGEQFDANGNRIYSSRVIDIDILLIDKQCKGEMKAGKGKYGNTTQQEWVPVTINTPNLIVPHPRLYEREFALKPLRELRKV